MKQLQWAGISLKQAHTKTFSCQYCIKYFEKQWLLRQHYKKKHSGKRFTNTKKEKTKVKVI